MDIIRAAKAFWLPFLVLSLYLAAICFRPLFPVDETRYMSAAWEMFLNKAWFDPLTVNFAPYHHKPPLLFWVINASWSVFGVSRWAGLIPVVLSSLACIYLTSCLGRLLFPGSHNQQRTWLVMAGSVPFMIYGTLVMFDFTLCVFVLLALLNLFLFSRERRRLYVIPLGLSLGLGVLTKGPVAYLYVLPVALLAPFWLKNFTKRGHWYAGILGAVFISILPVLVWLMPVLKESDGDFAVWLIWNQTAGRITGNFNAAHARPVWFYLPLVPVFFIPWILFPKFWKGLFLITNKVKEKHEGVRFLLAFLTPVFIAFSFISGKQPHYLIPLLPGMTLLTAYCLKEVKIERLAKVMIAVAILFIGAQAVASKTFFKRYTLEPIAEIIKTQPERELAFVRNYQGEMNFLARRNTPLISRDTNEIQQWFEEHPQGWAIIRFKDGQHEIAGLKTIFSYPYRGKNIGVFEKDSQ